MSIYSKYIASHDSNHLGHCVHLSSSFPEGYQIFSILDFLFEFNEYEIYVRG